MTPGAMSTRAEVEEALAGTDASGLRASFHRVTFLFNSPLVSFYRNFRPGGRCTIRVDFWCPPGGR